MPRNWRKALLQARQHVSDELFETIAGVVGAERVRRDEPLSRYTSYRIGGPADVLVTVPDEPALVALLPILDESGVPVTILGGGCNVLVLDGGIRGVVLKLGSGFDGIAVEEGAKEDAARVGAATSIGYLLKTARQRGWAGLAPIAGTPGTIGGALRMNAGDRNVWIGNFVETVRVIQKDGTPKELSRQKIGYGYRTSSFPTGSIITAGRFRFPRGDQAQVRAEIDAHIQKRKDTQPLNQPSGGSVFRNPEGGHAGELIERVGLKGVRLHQAQISPKHANFIVNLGEARARDVQALVRMAKQKVFEETGIRLEEELRVMGEPGEEDQS